MMEYASIINGHPVKDAFARSFVAEKDSNDCFYRMVGEEKEWINPPMVPGVEYRTIERFCGEPVYTKLCTFTGDEASTPNSYVVDTYPLNAEVVEIKAFVVIDNASEKRTYPLPAVIDQNGVYQGDYVMCSNYRSFISPQYTHGEVFVVIKEIDGLMDSKTYYVTIKYTKP